MYPGVPTVRSWNKPLHRSRRSASTHGPSSPNGGLGERCRSATKTMPDALHIASINFREDDGSLPTVEFDQLNAESVAAVYRFICKHGRCVSDSPTVWDNNEQVDVPLMLLDDPCRWLRDGRIDSFHCCFGGISVDGTVIPDLGLFVFKDAVQIDYRMGTEWNAINVDAFFRMLAYLKSIAPESKIKSAESEGLMDEESFLTALRPYLTEGGRTKP